MGKQMVENPICKDLRPCFGSIYDANGERRCRILYKEDVVRTLKLEINGKNKYIAISPGFYKNSGECPFCKPVKEVTNGKKYPYDTHYIGPEKKGKLPGEDILTMIKDKKIKQKEIAIKMGIRQNEISKMLHSNLTQEQFDKIQNTIAEIEREKEEVKDVRNSSSGRRAEKQD